MTLELVKEKYSGAINTVTIGAGGGAVRIGGETTMPFLFEEGAMPNAPIVAFEVTDSEQALAESYVKKYNAKLLCVRLQSIHPDNGKKSADSVVAKVKTILKSVKIPLIVVGCGDDEIDNEALPKVSQALKGEKCLFGIATQNNYKTLPTVN